MSFPYWEKCKILTESRQ